MSKYLSSELRIIAGKWRGRKLVFNAWDGCRPTTDRVRETLFNWLQFKISKTTCLDLFAGTGALGFEALSRGSEQCCFIENHPSAVKQLQQSAETFNASTQVNIVQANVWEWLTDTQAVFDLIFCDPPFASSDYCQLLESIAQAGILTSDGFLYIESPVGALTDAMLKPHWKMYRYKRHGQVESWLLHTANRSVSS